MPIPVPRANESKDKFTSRCVRFVVGEGKERDQAFAICSQKWADRNKKSTSITEIDVLEYLVTLRTKGLF